MTKAILAPLYLPVLQLVTICTLPITFGYAVVGLLLSPIIVPYLMFKAFINALIGTPIFLATLPISIPVGGVLSFLSVSLLIMKALWITFTPLLWPIYYLIAWFRATAVVSQVIIMDTILPFLVPLRYSILAALVPKAVTM